MGGCSEVSSSTTHNVFSDFVLLGKMDEFLVGLMRWHLEWVPPWHVLQKVPGLKKKKKKKLFLAKVRELE